jgi:hypothetical protein
MSQPVLAALEGNEPFMEVPWAVRTALTLFKGR